MRVSEGRMGWLSKYFLSEISHLTPSKAVTHKKAYFQYIPIGVPHFKKSFLSPGLIDDIASG